jgi:hypothetical protein
MQPQLDGKSNGAAHNDIELSACDYVLASGDIDEPIYSGILKEVTENKRSAKLVLCLVTYGGSANTAYRISKWLHAMYDDISVFVPSFCKSAGTLIACSANEIIMTPFGELGPLDVQLQKRDEIFEIKSGLVTNLAMEEIRNQAWLLFEHIMLRVKTKSGSVSFKFASEIAQKIASDMIESVYQRVNLDAIGDDIMNLRVATEYCERLNKRFGNLKPGAINTLVHKYPSHDFVIDFDETKELFHRVAPPSEELFGILKEHHMDMMVPSDRGTVLVKSLLPKKKQERQKSGGENGAKIDGIDIASEASAGAGHGGQTA